MAMVAVVGVDDAMDSRLSSRSFSVCFSFSCGRFGEAW